MQLEAHVEKPAAPKQVPDDHINRVLDYVRGHISRMECVPPQVVMSEHLQMGTLALRAALRELEARKVMLFERAHGMTRYRVRGVGVTPWFMTGATTYKKLHEDPGTIAMRKCLRCGKPFKSAHKGNRLCGCPE